MKSILAIGASSSLESINRTFARYAASQLENVDVDSPDLNDYEMPIYSVDREEADGIPQPAKDFLRLIAESDGVVISLAEHNGSYSAAFKNLLDWMSRENKELWGNKPMLLLSTSPGGRGGANVVGNAEGYFPHLGAEVAAQFSLGKYYDHFSRENGITDPEQAAKFQEALGAFREAVGL